MSAATTLPFEPTPMTADGMRALGEYWPKLERTIRRIAFAITPDEDDREDLIQSAMMEFWQLEPARYNLSNPQEFCYLREILVHRMWNVWGKDQGGEEAMAMRLLIPVMQE